MHKEIKEVKSVLLSNEIEKLFRFAACLAAHLVWWIIHIKAVFNVNLFFASLVTGHSFEKNSKSV